MGQGYHSKFIFGVILDDEQSAKRNSFNESGDKDLVVWEKAINKFKISESYDVSPMWIGIALASTDEWVAQKRKIADVSGGISFVEMQSLVNSEAVTLASKKFSAFQEKVKNIIEVDNPGVYLVTDYD